MNKTRNNTAKFFLDGKINRSEFVSREKPLPFDLPKFEKGIEELSLLSDDTKVLILRSMSFCYVSQKTDLGHLRKIFTEKAILTLEEDKFIKIIRE